MLQHFQEETARLKNQNDMLVKEIQQLKQERDQQSRLAVPSSRVGHESIVIVCHHLERHPTTHESLAWIPTGPRVPSGPPRSAVHLRRTLADLLRRKRTPLPFCRSLATKGPLRLSQLRVDYVPCGTSRKKEPPCNANGPYLLRSRGGKEW